MKMENKGKHFQNQLLLLKTITDSSMFKIDMQKSSKESRKQRRLTTLHYSHFFLVITFTIHMSTQPYDE